MRFVKLILAAALLSGLCGCGNMVDDLAASGEDKRTNVEAGSVGPLPGQTAPDFTLPNTAGSDTNLYASLKGRKGVVVYFTMWCPVCESHMDIMRSSIIPENPDVLFFAVDYVSASVAGALDAQMAAGFGGPGFTVLADTNGSVSHALDATMATVVVIDNSQTVLMNEDFKDGARLRAILARLP